VRFSLFPLVGALGTLACRPSTTRPPITPYPEAAGTEVRLSVPEATRHLAEALRADSIPTEKVRLRDGYIETGWFVAATGRRAASRLIGPGIVRVRAWADPARPGSSQLTVETLYRPLLDPSLPDRELERQVPRTHPVAVKVEGTLKALVDRYGGSPGPQAEPAPSRTREPGQANEPDQLDDSE
jgi:hypothetical protein